MRRHVPRTDCCDRRIRTVVRNVLITLSVGFLSAESSAAPPTLSHLFPAGGQRGTQVVATCTGEFAWPVQVWAPGVEVHAAEEKGKLEVSIPEDLAADRIWIRLHNEEGASAAVPFLIGGLKETMEQEPNNSPRNAQDVNGAGVVVNGILKEKGDVDGFAVELEAGQTLVASVDANHHLGSPMDAILQVATADGTVLAENHDALGLDPRIVYTAANCGTYVVRLFAFSSTPNTRIAFQNGDNYIYRLTLTTGPFMTHAIPLTVSQAEPGTADAVGWNVPPRHESPRRAFRRHGSGHVSGVRGGGRLANSPWMRASGSPLHPDAPEPHGFVWCRTP